MDGLEARLEEEIAAAQAGHYVSSDDESSDEDDEVLNALRAQIEALRNR